MAQEEGDYIRNTTGILIYRKKILSFNLVSNITSKYLYQNLCFYPKHITFKFKIYRIEIVFIDQVGSFMPCEPANAFYRLLSDG